MLYVPCDSHRESVTQSMHRGYGEAIQSTVHNQFASPTPPRPFVKWGVRRVLNGAMYCNFKWLRHDKRRPKVVELSIVYGSPLRTHLTECTQSAACVQSIFRDDRGA